MIERDARINESDLVYIPKIIKLKIGQNFKFVIVGEFVLLVNKNQDLKNLVNSIPLLKQALELKVSEQEHERPTNNKDKEPGTDV